MIRLYLEDTVWTGTEVDGINEDITQTSILIGEGCAVMFVEDEASIPEGIDYFLE